MTLRKHIQHRTTRRTNERLGKNLRAINEGDAWRPPSRPGADYAGFVFFERSPRNVSLAQAASLVETARGRIKTVALTVNATDEAIREIEAKVHPDFLQLHGDETPERIAAIRALSARRHHQGDQGWLRAGRRGRAPLRGLRRYSAVRCEARRHARRAARRKRGRLRVDLAAKGLRSGQISCFPAGSTLLMCSRP